MRQERAAQICLRLLNLSMIFMMVYLILVTLFTGIPKLLGMYDLPFDLIHFGAALLKTILALILCGCMRNQIREETSSGSFGVLLGIAAYFTCFILDWIAGLLYSYRLSYVISKYSSEMPIGQNISTASYIANFCSYAQVFFFTAIALMLVAYGIRHTLHKLENE